MEAIRDDLAPAGARWRIATALIACTALVPSCLAFISDPMKAHAAAIAGVCLVLWLLEVVAPFVPTLLLLTATPLLMSRFGDDHAFRNVLLWPIDPVIALFFGGFILAQALRRHGLDPMAFT